MMKPAHISFDFDGVIAPTFDLAFSIMEEADPSLTMQAYRDAFNGNIYDSDLSPVTDFFDKYEPHLMRLPIIPGIADVIEMLAQKHSLSIVSSTPERIIKTFLGQHKLDKCFSIILGTEVEKSKIKKFEMLFIEQGIGPDDCVFITDTLGDINEAREVDVKSIAVTWGFHNYTTLQDGNPYRIVETPAELLVVIQ